jgi:hypothetical protein
MMMMMMTLEENINKNLKLKTIRMSLDVYKIKIKNFEAWNSVYLF